MLTTAPHSIFVLLCNWRGYVVWASEHSAVGQLVWFNLIPASQELAKEALARVASLREEQQSILELVDGRIVHCWFWPLDSPEVAVCILCREVPAALHELTERELECLKQLACGLPTKEIAVKLEMSTSTLHSHLSHARSKLGLDSLEALISFAARYCYPTTQPLSGQAAPDRQPL